MRLAVAAFIISCLVLAAAMSPISRTYRMKFRRGKGTFVGTHKLIRRLNARHEPVEADQSRFAETETTDPNWQNPRGQVLGGGGYGLVFEVADTNPLVDTHYALKIPFGDDVNGNINANTVLNLRRMHDADLTGMYAEYRGMENVVRPVDLNWDFYVQFIGSYWLWDTGVDACVASNIFLPADPNHELRWVPSGTAVVCDNNPAHSIRAIVTQLCDSDARDVVLLGPPAGHIIPRPDMQHMFDGLQLLHTAGYAHLDLKPENILICNNVYKIADLGIIRQQLDKSQDLHDMAEKMMFASLKNVPLVYQNMLYTDQEFAGAWNSMVKMTPQLDGTAPVFLQSLLAIRKANPITAHNAAICSNPQDMAAFPCTVQGYINGNNHYDRNCRIRGFFLEWTEDVTVTNANPNWKQHYLEIRTVAAVNTLPNCRVIGGREVDIENNAPVWKGETTRRICTRGLAAVADMATFVQRVAERTPCY